MAIHFFSVFFSGYGIRSIENVFLISLSVNFLLLLIFPRSQMEILTDFVPMTRIRNFHWQSHSSLLCLRLLFSQYLITLPFLHYYLYSAAKLIVFQVISCQMTY